MKMIHPFALGQIVGALAVGSLGAAVLNLKAAIIFSVVMAVSAGVSALVCWRWPGFEAASWKLWLVGCLGNPLMLAALAYSASEYECLLGWKKGWDCILVEFGPGLAGLCSLPPIAGLVWRWWKGRVQ